MWITPPDICSLVSQITNIHIRDKKLAQLWWKYMLGGVGGSDWTANTLLVNMIICRTQSNNKTCAYSLTDDAVQFILARNDSIMPGYWALAWILTNFHIFTCSAHLTMIFTSLETPSSPLSHYVHSILLCCPSLVSARLCMALLIRALKTS